MEPLSNTIRVTVPNYLSNLPIPDSVGGWFRLGVRDWASLIPLAAAVGGVTYLTYKAFCPRARPDQKKAAVNPNIKKNVEKVVDMFDLEDIGDKVAFCRCWRSKNFPYCDGSHTPYNRESGDNVGPVCLSRKK
ncbi:hypothetical protein R5R35_003925 [Gryllus longicercus]|uniref:CDGSH iron-sulfur domain-containing protein 2 homologue n=1 Tax=Gryllus longicercus TaxID=2509291 RepID=A0AAN9VW15_9ORTH